MADEVEVKFGADTSDLDKGTQRATADVAGFEKSVQGVDGSLKSFASSIAGMFSGVAGAVGESTAAMQAANSSRETLQDGFGQLQQQIIAAFSVKAVLDWINSLSLAVRDLVNTGAQIGITATELSALEKSADNFGVTSDQVSKGVQNMARSFNQARDGSQAAREAFSALGINVDENITSLDLFLKLTDKFSTLPDGPEKTALAMKTLGRSGAELIPAFNAGRDAIVDGMQQAKDSGQAASQVFIDNGVAVANAINNMGDTADAFSQVMLNETAPAILAVVAGITGLIDDMRTSDNEGGAMSAVMKTLGIVTASVSLIVGALGVAISDILTVAIDIVVVTLGTFEASLIGISHAMRGDFAGAADAFSAKMDQVTAAIKRTDDANRKLHENYAKFAQQVISPQASPTNSSNSGNAAGEAIIAKYRQEQIDKENAKKEAAARAEQARIAAEMRAHQKAWQEEGAVADTALKGEQDDVKNNFDDWMALQQKRLQVAASVYGTDSKQYQALLNEKEKMERTHEQQLQTIKIQSANSQRSIDQINEGAENDAALRQIETARSAAEQRESLGLMTKNALIQQETDLDQQTTAIEEAHENKIYNLKLLSLEAEKSASNLRIDQVAAIQQQIEQLETAHQARLKNIIGQGAAQITKDQQAAATQTAAQWEQVTQPVAGAFSTLFGNILSGTQTFKQSLAQIGQQLIQTFANMAFQMAAKWIAGQAAMTTASVAGNATRTAADATAHTTSLALSGESALGQIINFAWTAAAGAFSALAGIPYVGPFLAVAAGAAALAAVIGFGANIASAEGGWERVPHDGAMAELHKDEMVLPSKIANPLRSAINGWSPRTSPTAISQSANQQVQQFRATSGDAGGGGDTHLHYKPTLNNYDQKLGTQLRTQSREMKKWFANQQRNGAI